jgi:hypothetical protein
MTCPVCFFREDNQKILKTSSFGIDRFENKLKRYKEKFIEGILQMDSLSKCNCLVTYNHKEMISWMDAFLDALKGAVGDVNDAFDNIISIYGDFIGKSHKIAIDRLWRYLKSQHMLDQTESSIAYEKLLFRARPKGGFDERDIKQYFHIPFSKRHLVGNQRFSVSGQPMLYFGSSALAITKELGRKIDELAIAGFLPSYSLYYSSKIFSLTNHIGDCIENSLPGIFSGGSSISYYDVHVAPNRQTISSDMRKAVLMHICTFPAEFSGPFVPEYAIPQMLTTALLENGYAGLVFPSTKDYSDLDGHHRFSSYHMNLGVFVPYDKTNDTNEALLKTFSVFTLDGSENFILTTKDIIDKANEIIEVNKKSTRNNNDYIIPICNLELNIEYMNESKIFGTKYFETNIGKLELELFMKMLCHLEKLVH